MFSKNFNSLKSFTSEQLWNEFIGRPVEEFISFFHAEEPPVTDLKDMCWILSRDIMNGLHKPYTVRQQGYIANRIEQYALEQIEQKGGYEKLKLLTEQEINAIEEETNKELHEAIEFFVDAKNKEE